LEDITAGYQGTALNDLPTEDANAHAHNHDGYLGAAWNIAPGQGRTPRGPLYVQFGEETFLDKIYHGSSKPLCSTIFCTTSSVTRAGGGAPALLEWGVPPGS